MRYGYISNYWPETYGLISPHNLVRISLATSSYSTFIICGNLNRLERWLRDHGTVKISLHDPFNFSTTSPPTLTLELRRQYNIFFSPFQLIIRPTILADLQGPPDASEPILLDHFRFPLYKKILVPSDVTCEELVSIISLAKLESGILHQLTEPIPASVYQVGKAQLNMAQFEIVARYRRIVIDRVVSNNYSIDDSDLPPPNYIESEAANPPLPRYSTLISNQFHTNSPSAC